MKLDDKNIINDPNAYDSKNFVTPGLEDKVVIDYDRQNYVQSEKKQNKEKDNIIMLDVEPANVKLHIVTWADVDKRTFMCWGDYWVKKNLEEAFINIGYNVIDDVHEADVNIYLFGSPYTTNRNLFNPKSYNIAWLYSHPDKVTASEFSKYNEVFVLSKSYISEIAKIYLGKLHIEPLYSCSNFQISDGIEYGTNNDLVIVANARGAGAPYGREVVRHLTMLKQYLPLKVKIWGHKWDLDKYDAYPREWFVDKYYDYYSLPKLYRSARAVLIDGHEDMWRWGFVPMKLFDVFASGGLPIIESNSGIIDIFGDSVLQYDDEKQLKDVIDFVNDERESCINIIERGYEIAKNFTYARTASIFDRSIKEQGHMTKPVKLPERKVVVNIERNGDLSDISETKYFDGKNRKGIIRI